MTFLIRLFVILLAFTVQTPAFAQQAHTQPRAQASAPKDPSAFYDFVHSIAPQSAVSWWRSSRPNLETLLRERGFKMGDPVFARIFKREGVMELWMKKGERFSLFEIYPICSQSGDLGPKVMEGDRQAPEGFYPFTVKQLHPNSRYHLAINMGYPNAYDKAKGRTGNFLMIHGACESIGCYALTNDNIEEFYRLSEAAFRNGQDVIEVHAFPFRMTQQNLDKYADNKWADFWKNELLPAYEAFELTRTPAPMQVCDGRYQMVQATNNDPSMTPASTADTHPDCKAVTGWR